MSDHTKWYWARFDDTECWSGGVPTRDDAVRDGRSEFDDDVGFYITKASNPPVMLADWIGDADDLLTRAEESIMDSDRVSHEHDESGIFAATPEQIADLSARIRAACNEWQASHGLVFTVRTFAWMSQPDYVPPVFVADGEAT